MPTYVPLQSVTLTSNTTIVTFTGIDQSYKDLRLVMTPASSSGTNGIRFRVGNGTVDTGSNYSYTAMDGNGSTAGSYRESAVANGLVSYRLGINTSFTQNYVIDFMDYSNTTTFKTVLGRYSDASAASGHGVFTWRSTVAIDTISLNINTFGSSTGDFIAGSTFDLYGISPSNAKVTSASGGTAIYYDSTYAYHVFTGTAAFTPNRALSADVLVVAGGGGGGFWNAGGGGAGGLLGFSSQSLTAQNYTVIVGAGGSGSLSSGSVKGTTGNDSQFGALTLVKGGGGGGSTASSDGSNGGSGGGAAGVSSGSNSGGSPTSGQGFAGASGQAGAPYIGGGGGGAGEAGNTDTQGFGGDGVTTYSSWATATSTGSNGYYAGGGAGGRYDENARNVGGDGGGGNGGIKTAGSQDGISGITNTGGGGGGGGYALSISEAGKGGNGGSGIVIVRYVR